MAKIGFVEPRITKSSLTWVCLLQDGPTSARFIELGAAHVSLVQTGASQQHLGHQRELHIGLGETGVLEPRRNEICP